MTISTMYEAPFPMTSMLATTRRLTMQHTTTTNSAASSIGFLPIKYTTLYTSLADLPEPAEYITIYDSNDDYDDDYDDDDDDSDGSKYAWRNRRYFPRYPPSLSSVSVNSERPRKLPSSASSLRKYTHDRAWRQALRPNYWWWRLRQILLCNWCSTFDRQLEEGYDDDADDDDDDVTY